MQDFQSPYSSDSTGPFSSRCIDFEFHISNRWRQDDGHILHFTLDSSVKSIRWRSCLQKQDVARKSSVLGSDIMHFTLVLVVVQWGESKRGQVDFSEFAQIGFSGGVELCCGRVLGFSVYTVSRLHTQLQLHSRQCWLKQTRALLKF